MTPRILISVQCFYIFARYTRLGFKNLDFFPSSANYSQMGVMLEIAKMEKKCIIFLNLFC